MPSFLKRCAHWAFAALLACVSMSAAAQVTYSNTCASCHGVTGSGSPPMLPSQGNVMLNAPLGSEAELRTFIKRPGSLMTGQYNIDLVTVAELEAIRLYMLNVRNGSANGTLSSSYGTVGLGDSATRTVTVTVRNYRGNTASDTNGNVQVTINGTSLAGTDFSLVSAPINATCAASATTSFNECTYNVNVRFTPTATGLRLASLQANVSRTSASDPQPVSDTILLSGTGQQAQYTITPANPASVQAKVGSSVNMATQTIRNTATVATLTLGTLSYSNPAFARSPGSTCNSGTSLVPGAECSLITVFTPPGAGAVSGSLSIPHNGTGSPDTVSLNGTGTVPAISPTSTSLNFDNVQLGVPRAATPLVVTNTGNASLVFATNPTSPAALSGPGAADYSVASTCNPASPLAPSGTCTITVTFTPSVLGSRTATLTVNSDASNGPLTVNLSGTGVALPEPVVTGPGSDFPDTVVGQTSASTRTVTLLNNRTLNIGYSLTVGGDFLITAESCGTRVVPGGGGSCTVTLAFRPALGSGEGPRGATVPISFTGTGGNPNPSPVNISLAGRALLPITLSTGSLSFSAVVGSPTTSTAVVTNRSSAAITLSTLSFSGAAAADYSVDGSSACIAGGSIAAGASCNLVLRFNPPAAGARNATLTLAHSGLGSPQTLNLVGTAIPAPQGRIELSAFSLAFPDTQLGSASPVQTLTVRNSGDLALTFSAFNLGGAAAADYERAGSCSTAAALAIGAECTVSLTFRPGALGARAASLTVLSDASNGPATVTLTGTGIPVPVPVVSLSATSIDFGAQTVGGLYPARSVRLSNTGTANLAPTIALVGAGYLLNAASPCPGTLAPGAACDIELRFAPTAANTDYPAVLRVTSNAAGSPHDVALSGRGTAVVVPVLAWQASVAQLSFGNVSAGSVSAAQSATLVNQGPGGVTVALVNTVGADAAGFVVTGGTCATGQVLFEGQSCRVDVAFAPAFAGAKTAQLQVATNGSPPPAFGLQGTGLSGPAAAWRLSAATIDFPATRIATRSNPLELILSSTGSTSLRVTAIAVDGPFAIQDSTCPAAPFSLPAGAQCALRVVFAPATTGSAVGQLRVSTDAATASADVRLNGQGDPAADVSSGGGCSMIDGDRPLLDPTLWLLAALSALVLWRRRAQRQAAKTPQ